MAAAGARTALVVLAATLAASAAASAPPAPPGVLAFGAPGEISGVIVQIDTRGRGQRTIRGNGASEPVFSRDGKRLAYLFSLNELWVAAANGSAPRRLVRVRGETMSRPTWSPDGRRIAYVGPPPTSTRDRRGGLWIVDVVRGTARRVAAIAAGAEPDWSPDGRWIAYSAGGLRLVAIDGKRTRRISTLDAIDPRWSPGGRWIAFQTLDEDGGSVQLRIVDVASGRLRTLATSAAPGSTVGPLAWSPGGTWLAYTTTYEETVTYDEILFEIRALRLRDGGRRLILDTRMTELYGLAWRRT